MIFQIDCDRADKVITHSVAEPLMQVVINKAGIITRMLASEFIICIYKDDHTVLVEAVVEATYDR